MIAIAFSLRLLTSLNPFSMILFEFISLNGLTRRCEYMNRIYWDRYKISILTDQIESIEHKHYAIQLFLSIDKPLNLYVSGKLIAGKCVIVNHNVNHVFSTGNKLHLSIIIEPASNIAKQLEMKMNGNDFYLSGCNPAHTSSHGCSIYSQNIPFKQLQRQGNRRLSSNRGKSWKRVIVKPVKSFTIDKKSFDLG